MRTIKNSIGLVFKSMTVVGVLAIAAYGIDTLKQMTEDLSAGVEYGYDGLMYALTGDKALLNKTTQASVDEEALGTFGLFIMAIVAGVTLILGTTAACNLAKTDPRELGHVDAILAACIDVPLAGCSSLGLYCVRMVAEQKRPQTFGPNAAGASCSTAVDTATVGIATKVASNAAG